MAKPEKEKYSLNLPTCRATPTQAMKLKSLLLEHGFSRPSDFWRRCLMSYIAQREAGHALKWPLEFARESPPATRPRKPLQ